ncbi:unnamed protein product [Diamesa serratosioi]
MNTFVVAFLVASLALTSALTLKEDRIAGGVDSKPGEQPSFVYMSVLFEEKTQNCGGVLIKPNYVLTSASCVKDASEGVASTVDISLGGSNKPDKAAPKVCQIIVKPEYLSTNNSIDNIALIKLCSDIKKSKTIDLAEMETNATADAYVGKTLTACGFGNIDNKKTKPKNLQCTTLTGILSAECIPTNPDTICTSSVNDNNVCGGDNGGPLFLNHTMTGRLTLAGIYAFSADARPNARCLDGHKSVFTQVGAMQTWINDNAK